MAASLRLTLGAVATWLGLASAASAEVAAPDSAERAELRERLSGAGMVRVLGTFGAREVPHPLLDSIGIISADWLKVQHQRPALMTANATPPAMPPAIAWSDVNEIQAGHSMAVQGLTIGLLSGLVIDMGEIVIASNIHDETALGFVGAVILTPILTSFIGASVGASRGRWHTVYRAHAQEKP
ncbi:MAG TPA: hypothetical protein VL123_03935 [Candidatus Udaeobacter sp.]|jgi:hypothetical protein|nr:hypothetical protein [Candidatus Udaeobacter sp.]